MITVFDLIIIVVLITVLNIIGTMIYTKKTEKFIVADANDFAIYDELKAEELEKEDNFDKQELAEPADKNVVTYTVPPAKDDFTMMVVHGKPPVKQEKNEKTFMTPVDFGWEAPTQYVSCANSSIAQRFKTGDKPLLPNQISCDAPNKLTAENYYKVHAGQIVPMEDQNIKGYNYEEYSNAVNPFLIRNLKILSPNTKGLPASQMKYRNIPVGSNYAFHNTPAMPMP